MEQDKQQIAVDKIKAGHNFFLSGMGGVGKSYVIDLVTDNKTIKCAPTGNSALNIGGITCHSLFGLPLTIPSVEDYYKVTKKMRQLILEGGVKRVIIDECFKAETEIMTSEGFVRFDELKDSSKVAQYHPDTSEIDFVTPTRVVRKNYNGDMVNLKSKHKINLTTTANHDYLVYSPNGSYSKIKAKDLKCTNKNTLKTTGKGVGKYGTLTDVERFSIACQAKGIYKDFSQDFKIEDFSYSRAREFISELASWEGYKADENFIIYKNVSKNVIDFVQTVAVLGGYNTSVIKVVDNRKKPYSEYYKLSISDIIDSITLADVEKTSEHFEGKVYCATVPTGNIIIRSEGRCVVIGNCSLLRADMLDLIDKKMQVMMGNKNPFGGIQMVLVGDFYQIEPIIHFTDREVYEELYESGFCFTSNCWYFESLELTKSYRNLNQNQLAVLSSIRKRDKWYKKAVDWVNRNAREYDNSVGTLHLCCYNKDADTLNSMQYRKIKSKEYCFYASKEGDWSGDTPVKQKIKLKKGCRVLIKQNDLEGGTYVNGDRGYISTISDHAIKVTLDRNNQEVEIKQGKWDQHEYKATARGLETYVKASFYQYPITLGYAVSVHSVQGLTLDDVALDFGKGCFTHGQAYVALSRVKDLKNISLVDKIDYDDIICDELVKQFYEEVK